MIKGIDFNTKRHKKYLEYADMYDNHEDAYLGLSKDNRGDSYFASGIPRELIQVYSDLAFGNPINASVKDDPKINEYIDEIIDRNQLDMQLSEASLTQAFKGEIVAKNYVDNNKSKISFIDPQYYFPILSPTDQRKVLKDVIAIPYKDPETNKEFIYCEIYEPRQGVMGNIEYWCVTKTFDYKNNKLGNEVKETKEFNTTLEESPITFIPFSRSGSNFWGESLYKGVTNDLDKLEHRLTEIDAVLDKHSNPAMWAESGVFDDDGNLRIKDKVFEVKTDEDSGKRGDSPIGYITWNWNAGDANFKYINEILFKILHYVSPIVPSLYGLDTASQASGSALKVKSWRTQCKITRAYQYWRPALKKILYLAQVLEVKFDPTKNYTPKVPNVELLINLPQEALLEAQAEQLKVESKVSSHKSSIARLNPHYSEKEVEDEWLEIINEQNEINNQTFMGDMLGFNQNKDANQDENKSDDTKENNNDEENNSDVNA